jgi:NAD(P)-dependent dehydrogenase (short-subunit alcohol dehydrogenase family)
VVKTNLWNSLSEADRNGLYNATAAHVPVKYVAEPGDIALTYLYLMKQPYGTGQGVVVDGGATLV